MSLTFEKVLEGPGEPWRGYDFDKLSRAVVVVDDRDNGCMLYHVGGALASEIDQMGKALSDLGLWPPEAGIWVWEGSYVWHSGSYEYPTDGETEAKGTWREPNDAEWTAIRAGDCPWNDDEWHTEEWRAAKKTSTP